jgi:hypothetical protein
MVAIDAYSSDANLVFDPTDAAEKGRVSNYFGPLSADVMRIMKIQSSPITDYVGSGAVSYRLTAAAQVTVKIYNAGVTFTGVDTTPSSSSYGDPIPAAGYTPLKMLKFYRPAGNWAESWDGYSEGGTAMADGLYTFSISAANGTILAASSLTNDGSPLYGNITIMRTAPPTDSSGSGSGSGSGTGTIVVGSYAPGINTVVRSNVTAVIVGLADDALAIDTAKSAITITDPNGKQVQGQVLTAGKYVGINVPPMNTPGNYAVNVKLVASNGKYWNDSYKFAVARVGAFSDQVYAWPNPIKSGSKVTVNLPLNASTFSSNVKIFNLVGDLIKDVDVQPAVQPKYEWNVSDVGNGVYFCRVECAGDKVVKKIIVAK